MTPGHRQLADRAPGGALRVTTFVLLVLGVAMFVALIAHEGVGNVYDATAAAGWGVVAVALFHLLPLVGDGLAWRVLLPQGERLTAFRFVRMRLIGESVNGLLPAAQLGGELVKIRIAILEGVPSVSASASITADVTLGVLSQIIFTLAGIGMLMYLGAAVSPGLVTGTLIGIGALTLLIVAFLIAQHAGFYRLLAGAIERLAGRRDWLDLAGGAAALDKAVTSVYSRRADVARSMIWRLAAWTVGVGEIWLALLFLGHPVSFAEAFMIESLSQAVRAVGFAIPGALGVQEGGFILLGSFIGLDPDLSLALSLVRRFRELAIGVPALIGWQIQEGGHLLRRRRT